MDNLYRITKVSLVNSIGISKLFKSGKEGDVNKGLFATIGIGIGMLLVAIMPFVYANAIANVLVDKGLLDLLLVGAIVMSSLIVFITSIVKAQGILFSAKDYEMLMALPIKQSVILASKMIQLLILNYVFIALILIPTSIVYFNKSDISPMFFVYLMISFIFVPLVPIVAASIIAFILSYFSSKIRMKNLFLIISNFALVIGIMVVSAKINVVIDVVTTNSESIVASICKIYPPALYFTKSLTDLSIVNSLVFIILSTVPFMIFLFIFGRYYNNINSKLGESFKSSNYKLKSLKLNSPIKGLIKKEIKGYFSCPIYILNTSVMVVMMIIGSFSSLFLGKDILMNVMNVPGGQEILPTIMMAAMALIVSLSCTTNSSISLEGKKLWILKSLPIDEMDIFKAKITVNLLILIPAILINSCILLISLKMNLIDFIWMIIIPSLYALIISIGGLLINLHFPKLDWISETAVVKQSISSIVSLLFGGLLVVITLGGLVAVKIENKNLYLVVLSIVLLLVIFLLIRLLEKKGRKMFREL